MSEQHAPDDVPIPPEADRPEIGRILRIALVTILGLGAGVAATYWMTVDETRAQPARSRGITYANLERARNAGVSIDERLINRSDPGLELRARQRAYLEAYGWVDRDAGIAHVPIDRAIELHARGVAR